MRSLALALFVPALSWAAPQHLAYQGRLVDATGAPIAGSHSLRFTLYSDAGATTSVWTETDILPLTDGYFSATLGDQTSLGAVDFSQSLWIAVRVGTDPEMPPQPLTSVASALNAGGAMADTASPPGCGPSTSGALWLDGATLKVCNGSNYLAIGSIASAPAAPATTTVTASASGAVVSWAVVSGATSYEVGYNLGSTLSGTPTVVAVPSGTSTTLPWLGAGAHAFAVRAKSAGGASLWTSTVTSSDQGTLQSILTSQSLTTNLKLVLDAGDSASYSPSQTFADRSGGGFDFRLGETANSESSDPFFAGTVGQRGATEYFSFDGGDWFLPSTGSNAAWMNAIGTSGAKFAWAGWYYHPAGATRIYLFNNADFSPNGPILVELTSAKTYRIASGNEGNVVNVAPPSATLDGRWHFFAGVSDQVGTTQLYWDGAVIGTDTGGFSAGSSTSWPLTIGARTDNRGAQANPNGTRLAMLAMWQGSSVPTISQIQGVYDATRTRFGL
jgi:hypothetical protein